MQFEFATASRIIFGTGRVKGLPAAASSWGRRALVVVGRSMKRASSAIEGLRGAGLRTDELHAAGEPTVDSIQEGVEQSRLADCDVVIAIGGGSVIDTGKAVAALAANPGQILDYLEVVGKGRPLQNASLPFIAVPTTSGTGSEVTRNAVLGVPEKRVKVSLRSILMLPRLAIVDPELTYDAPPQVTAASGMDALAQLIEPFLSIAANAMMDALCRDGIRRAARSLRRAYNDGSDHDARADMALAALFSGLAFANARLGAVHGFAGPIGGMFPAPHGAVCARLLPAVLRANLFALRQREPHSKALERFDELARLLTGSDDARADAATDWLLQLCAELQIPPLRTYGMTAADFPQVMNWSRQSSSMKGNPIALTDGELTAILEEAL